LVREIKIEYLKTRRRITHPSGHVTMQLLGDIDRYVATMEAERDYLTQQIDSMTSEKAKCVAVVGPAPVVGGIP